MGTHAMGWLAARGGRGWLSSGAGSSRRWPSNTSPLPGSGLSSGPSSSPLMTRNVLRCPGPQPPAPCPIQGPVFLSCSEPLRLHKGLPRVSVMEFWSYLVFPQLREAQETPEDPGLRGPACWAGAGRDSKLPLDPPAGLDCPRARDPRPSGAPSPNCGQSPARPRPLQPIWLQAWEAVTSHRPRVFWADRRLCSARPWACTDPAAPTGPAAHPLLLWVLGAG